MAFAIRSFIHTSCTIRHLSLLLMVVTAVACDARSDSQAPDTPVTAQMDLSKAQKHPTGFHYEVLQEGDGTAPKLGSTVRFHWTCWDANGNQIQDTRGGDPQQETLSEMELISGVVTALSNMKPGARWKLRLPSELAYGARGYPGLLDKDSDLTIDLELVAVE